MRRKLLALASVAISAVVVSVIGRAQAQTQYAPLPGSFHVRWSMKQSPAEPYVGYGAALSSDGRFVVYAAPVGRFGTATALTLADLQSRTGRVLVTQSSIGRDFMSHPSFSPDGERIVFIGSGESIHYPSDLYAFDVHTNKLIKLTHASYIPQELANKLGDMYFDRYYSRPTYSPDGSRILLDIFNRVQEKELVAIMNADGTQLQILGEGRPWCWSVDGQSVFYDRTPATNEPGLVQVDIATHVATVFPPPLGSYLGRLPDRPWFALNLDNGIGWYSFEEFQSAFKGLWRVPQTVAEGGETFKMKQFDWSKSGDVLLRYESDKTQWLRVVRFTSPPPAGN